MTLYTNLGRTGLIVSRLCLGTMSFGAGSGNPAVARIGVGEADALVGRALDAGVNFFDTADVYSAGEAEAMLGRALGRRRDEVVIATKAGWRTGQPLNRSGLSAGHLQWSIDGSLRRLGTDYVDVFIAHREDAHTPLEETLAALDAIVRAGKARYLGVSNWSAWKIAAAVEIQRANGWAQFSHIQMMYHLLGRAAEHQLLPMAAHYGLGFTAWSPLAGGFLSGKYTRDNLADPDNRLSGFDVLPVDKDKGFALVERMRGVAEAHGAIVTQVALAWLLAQPAVASVLIGASTLSLLGDDLAAADLALSPGDLLMLNEATNVEADFTKRMTELPDAPVVAALAARPGRRPDVTEGPTA